MERLYGGGVLQGTSETEHRQDREILSRVSGLESPEGNRGRPSVGAVDREGQKKRYGPEGQSPGREPLPQEGKSRNLDRADSQKKFLFFPLA